MTLARDARETLGLLRDPVLLAWALYILLFPVYVFSSGLPQPGDWLVIGLLPLALARWKGRMPAWSSVTLRILVAFTLYVFVVNILWSFALGAWTLSGKKGFGLSPVFYIYNALVFFAVLVVHTIHGPRLLRVTSKVVLFTLVAQVVLSFFVRGGSRATVLFNNPNQLGYYALLSASILMLLQRRRYTTTVEVAIGTLAATYLCLLSASKAALAALGLLIIAGMFARLRTMLLTAAAFGALLLVASPVVDAMSDAITRIETDESHAFAEERGYDRILEHPEYWIMGAGEGAYVRFKETSAIGSHEIHSSIGTLFFSYGIVGTGLFALFAWMTLRRTGLRTWLIVMPSFAYGMTHQGLRFTLFWVLLALVVVLREELFAQRSSDAMTSATLVGVRQ